MSREFVAQPENRFSFGLWTVGNRGRDPFGEAVRPKIEIDDMLRGLADIGVYGVSFHDDDLMTFGAPESQRRAELDAFKKTLEETGLVCTMATTNLFYHPTFKDGAFTSNDRDVRRYAIQKSMRNIDVAAELGAPTYVFWGGREGVESAAAKDTRDALSRYAEALDFLGGKGKVMDAVVGGLVIAVIANGLPLITQQSGIQFVVTGFVLLVAAGVDAISRKRASAT